jgi:hypothetical protein
MHRFQQRFLPRALGTAAALAVAFVGCVAPRDPPASVYRCTAGDPACPEDQVCILARDASEGVCRVAEQCHAVDAAGTARPVDDCVPCTVSETVPGTEEATGVCTNGECTTLSCDNPCRVPRCGDTCVDADQGEVCDTAPSAEGEACRADCSKYEVCGDGIVDSDEDCDDGADANPADGCFACGRVIWQRLPDPPPVAPPIELALGDHCAVACVDDDCRTIGVCGQAGILGRHLSAPEAAILRVAADATPRAVYIADTGNHRVVRAEWYAGGDDSCALARDGTCDEGGSCVAGDDATVPACEEDALCTRGTDATDCDGAFTVVVGTGAASSAGNGRPARQLPVNAPRALAIDVHGNLFIASDGRLREVANVDGDDDADGDDLVINLADVTPDRPDGLEPCVDADDVVTDVAVDGDILVVTTTGATFGCRATTTRSTNAP